QRLRDRSLLAQECRVLRGQRVGALAAAYQSLGEQRGRDREDDAEAGDQPRQPAEQRTAELVAADDDEIERGVAERHVVGRAPAAELALSDARGDQRVEPRRTTEVDRVAEVAERRVARDRRLAVPRQRVLDVHDEVRATTGRDAEAEP